MQHLLQKSLIHDTNPPSLNWTFTWTAMEIGTARLAHQCGSPISRMVSSFGRSWLLNPKHTDSRLFHFLLTDFDSVFPLFIIIWRDPRKMEMRNALN